MVGASALPLWCIHNPFMTRVAGGLLSHLPASHRTGKGQALRQSVGLNCL